MTLFKNCDKIYPKGCDIMGISDQFSGLTMEQLIGNPLKAAAEAQVKLTQSTADFINKVGFDENGKTRTISFQYEKPIVNDDQKVDIETMKIDTPMLGLVSVPNLQVDEVNVLFDMEVHKTVGSEEKAVASVIGINEQSGFKVNISGAVSQNNKSNLDESPTAEYHVHVDAKNDQMPENVAQILEIMSDTIELKE